MRLRERLGGAGNDLEPRGQRYRRDSALALRPIREISFLHVFGLEEKGRRTLELHVIQPNDVGTFAELAPEQTEKRQLPFKRTEALLVEAEFESAPFAQSSMSGEPNFAETARPKLPLQRPVRSSGNFGAYGRPPAEGFFVARQNLTACLGIVWRDAERRETLRADLENLERLVDPGKAVRPVGHPA
jgi:hypothetical protein